MKLDFIKIIDSRQEDKNTKYSDSYLKAKIKRRLTKINRIDTRGDIYVENGCLFSNDEPYTPSDPKSQDLVEQIEMLIKILDCL